MTLEVNCLKKNKPPGSTAVAKHEAKYDDDIALVRIDTLILMMPDLWIQWFDYISMTRK